MTGHERVFKLMAKFNVTVQPSIKGDWVAFPVDHGSAWFERHGRTPYEAARRTVEAIRKEGNE